MDVSFYYLIFFLGICALIGLCRSWLLCLRYGSRRLVFLLTRYLQYPVLIQIRHWSDFTRLNALCLLLYIACNCIALAVYTQDARELEQRAAKVAITNMVVLFLGGRTNPAADLLGISIQSYYLAHHWIGCVAAAEAMLYAIIVITLRPRLGTIVITGSLVSNIFSLGPPLLTKTYRYSLQLQFSSYQPFTSSADTKDSYSTRYTNSSLSQALLG